MSMKDVMKCPARDSRDNAKSVGEAAASSALVSRKGAVFASYGAAADLKGHPEPHAAGATRGVFRRDVRTDEVRREMEAPGGLVKPASGRERSALMTLRLPLTPAGFARLMNAVDGLRYEPSPTEEGAGK